MTLAPLLLARHLWIKGRTDDAWRFGTSDRWRGVLQKSWRRLNPLEEAAWRVWHAVRGQIVNHQPPSKKDGKPMIVIDGVLAWTVMRDGYPPVPAPWRQAVWNSVLMLDDVWRENYRHHRPPPCFHDGPDDDPLAMTAALQDGRTCPECVERWRCTCGEEPLELVWCSEC